MRLNQKFALIVFNELRKKDLAKDKKVMYLKLLIHIVGDLHQPLHASPEGTTGGNDIKLTWFNTPSNLHRVWDEQLIEFQQLSYKEISEITGHPIPKLKTDLHRAKTEMRSLLRSYLEVKNEV